MIGLDDLDSLFGDDEGDTILCPVCVGVGGPECPRCRGANYVPTGSLDADERFAAGLLPIDWAAPVLPSLEEQDHPDGYLTDDPI